MKVRGDIVRVGDDLIFLGRPYRVLDIRPYSGGPDGTFPESARYAVSYDGWEMTLDPRATYEINPSMVGLT